MIKIFVLLCSAALFFTACTPPVKGKNGVTYKSAIQYNDYIIDKQSVVIDLIDGFNESSDSSIAGISSFIDDAVAKINKIIADVEGMPEWRSSPVLRDKAVTMFKEYKSMFAVSYKRMLAISGDGEITTQEEKELKDIDVEIERDVTAVEDAFLIAQKEYASKNNMKLEDKTSKFPKFN